MEGGGVEGGLKQLEKIIVRSHVKFPFCHPLDFDVTILLTMSYSTLSAQKKFTGHLYWTETWLYTNFEFLVQCACALEEGKEVWHSTLRFRLCQKCFDIYMFSFRSHACHQSAWHETEELLKEGCHCLICKKCNGITFSSNGLYTLGQLAILSVNGLSESEHSTFTQTTSGPAKTGFMPSSNNILILCYPQHLALTWNVPRPLIILLSTSTLMNSPSLLNHWVFPSRTYTTWMRRDARVVVKRRVAKGSTYTHGDSVPSTSIIVLILNLSLSLRLSVQTELSSSQDLYFQACLSALSGLTAIQTLCVCTTTH